MSPDLLDQVGKDTGIAASEVYVGEGVNAENIKQIVRFLQDKGWEGHMSLEARGETKTAQSLEWFRGIL